VVGQESSDYVSLDGQDFKEMVRAARLWLRQHQEAINALNVFPVPDGDTGTNMTLTMNSAWQEIENQREDNIGIIVGKVAHGALMGARGNSGVILSQIWRGFAHSLADQSRMDAQNLAKALQSAADTAYKGVVKPVEGTILTVMREVAEASEQIARESKDLREMFERLIKQAKATEARTPALLPVLQEAGVVDSGGQGLVVILEGMWRALVGLSVETNERFEEVVDLAAVTEPGSSAYPEEHLHFDSNYPYDVQFIIEGQQLDVGRIRREIEAMGDCPLTVGDSHAVKVHVHVSDPGAPISYGIQQGSLRDVVVENMQAQYQEFISGRDEHPVVGPSQEQVPSVAVQRAAQQEIGVVVVASGEGIRQIFQSLGATGVVRGGQTMNPSTADILEGLEQLQTHKAIILPNNKNILMAAEQAAEMCEDKDVAVVPTKSIPQGVSALLALDQQATLDGNVSSMLQMANEVVTGEVTRAVRDVQINGLEVEEGDVIGLLDDELLVAGEDYDKVVHQLLDKVDLDFRELVTLYFGEGITEEQAENLADALSETHPELEIEVIYGGQPHYPYLFSVE
jgi:DAK2 domain fusion protein YloV